MSKEIGKIGWIDITVDDADGLRDFYADVVGLKPDGVNMDGYEDYNMLMPETGEPVCGVCHARGSNADQPGGWMIYFIVADVESSAAASVERGGKILVEPRGLAGGRYCVIEDPSGARAALYQP